MKWDNFLKNLGQWRGTFSDFTFEGQLLTATPSLLTLAAAEENQRVDFSLQRFANGVEQPPTCDLHQEYRSLGKQIIFFHTGAFSKGSLVFSPFSELGGEFGFIAGDRRCRLVVLYGQGGHFQKGVLIREMRGGTTASENPPLTLDQLWGTWEGEVYTAYPDFRAPEKSSSRLTLEPLDGQHLRQTLEMGDRTIHSQGQITPQGILTETGQRVTFLPDGASLHCPAQLPRRQPFFLEAGWLVSPQERHRMMRCYNEKGDWEKSILIVERKQ